MTQYSRYITLLDSASSAYPSTYRHDYELSWWLPTEEQRNRAFVFGSSKVMFRLLFGDVLTLPRNQAFDSPVFYSIASEMLNLKMEWVNISILTRQHPTPLMFVKEVAERFKDKNFLLSAWPGLEPKQRKKIYENLERTGNFNKLLQNVGDLSGQQLEIFIRQQEILNKLFEYIESHPGTLLQSNTGKMTRSLWKRLGDKNIHKQLGSDAEILKTIPERLEKNEDLGSRGILYKGIAEYPEESRDRIREIIDQQYYYIMAESTTNGSIDSAPGLYSNNTINEQLEQINAGDMQYDKNGVESTNIQTIEDTDSQEIKNIGSLSWPDMVTILNDKDFQNNLSNLRIKLSNSKKNEVPKIINDHLNYLLHFIPEKVIAKSDETMLSLGFIHLDKENNKKLVKIYSSLLGLGVFRDGLEVFLHGQFNRIQHKVSEKNKSELAGKLRSWLTPPLIKQD